MQNQLLRFLQSRVSSPRLADPAPSGDELSEVLRAALRAPDHMLMRPWRYVQIEGESRERLGQLFLRAALVDQPEMTEVQRQKYLSMPLRAPMIWIAISSNVPHPKVPVLEQQVSTGVGIGYALLALRSMGYNGIWRTGHLAENELVKSELGLKPQESIIGFLYIGTPVGDEKPIPDITLDSFLQSW